MGILYKLGSFFQLFKILMSKKKSKLFSTLNEIHEIEKIGRS